jgi:hypothetical protein
MHLAAAVGCPTPITSALVQLAGVINRIDYAQEGLTIEQMGLAGMDAAQIRAHAGGACFTGLA